MDAEGTEVRRATDRASLRVRAIQALALLLTAGTAAAENIDPMANGSQYAWAENVGWLNAEPLGNAGPGIEVDDLEMTGWMWGENIGWVSLSCTNTASCGQASYGVTNDACGVLGGYAWSESVGWINFAPATCGGDPTCGVRVSPTNGAFSGRAWAANAGWITFSAPSPHPYGITTAWRRAVPPATAGLSGAKQGDDVLLSWAPQPGATAYDVVRGALSVLRGSNGDFQAATETCLAQGMPATSISSAGVPAPGDGYWYLVRGVNCGGKGPFDDGTQAGSREAGIAASGNDCP
jgi:hypothetical protein